MLQQMYLTFDQFTVIVMPQFIFLTNFNDFHAALFVLSIVTEVYGTFGVL